MQQRDTIASMLLDQLKSTPEWMDQAKCSDGELDPFDPADKEAFIREKCSNCPVIEQCRSHFSGNDDLQGVFYGEDL